MLHAAGLCRLVTWKHTGGSFMLRTTKDKKDTEMPIRLTVQLSIKEGQAAEFEAAAAPALARVRAEDKGCEMYDLFRSCDDNTRYVMVECWTSEADLEAHKTSAAMGGVGAAIGGFIAGPPVMHQYEG